MSRYIHRIVLVAVFLFFTPLTLILSVFSLVGLFNSKSNIEVPALAKTDTKEFNTRILAASDNNTFPSTSSHIVIADGREQILSNYLETVNSELLPFASLLVSTADKYGLDFRLLTAIAIKESGACRVIPPGSHNCWGWGIHSAGTLGFDSYEEAIEIVSKGIKENYIDLGYVTPNQIMKKYAHKDSTTWGPDVEAYMAALQ